MLPGCGNVDKEENRRFPDEASVSWGRGFLLPREPFPFRRLTIQVDCMVLFTQLTDQSLPRCPTLVARVCHCRACADAFIECCHSAVGLQAAYYGGDMDAIVDAIALDRPDVVVLDLDIAEGGFEMAARLRRRLGEIKLVFVVGKTSDVCIRQALTMRAWGLLLKQEPAAALVRHVQRVASGEHSFSDPIAQRLAYDMRRGEYRLLSNASVASLNAVQLQILRHLARGDSIKMVASKMRLSYKSIDGHKNRLMKKIGVHDRVLLSRFAIREGLVEP